MRVQEPLIAEEAADDVLREIHAVDAVDQLLWSPSQDLPLRPLHGRTGCGAFELPNINRDRVAPDPDGAAAVEGGLLAKVDGQPHVLLAGQQEVAHIRVGLQTDDVGREQAIHDLLAHVARQHLPVLRSRPWNMDEVLKDRIGKLATDESGNQVKVVIVREDQGTLAATACLANDLLGEELVDPTVSLVPGEVGTVVEHGGLGQVPEVVLNKPEQRVGDRVVVKVISQTWGIDPAHLEA
jgi:hypothetical protein